MPTPAGTLLKAYAGTVKNPLRLAALCTAVNAGLMVGQYALLAQVVDAVLFHGSGIAPLWPRLWGILALILARAVTAYGTEVAASTAAGTVKESVRRDLLAHLFALGPVRLAHERTGDLAAMLVEGVEALEPYYARFRPAMSAVTVIPLVILAVVLPADWPSALILIGTAPLIPLAMILIGKNAEKLNQKQWAALARMSAHFLEVIQGLTTLKLFNASRREAEVIATVSDDYRQTTMSVLRIAFLSSLALEFFATVSIALVAVLIGFRLLGGSLGFERGFFVLLLAPEFYAPLRSLGTNYHARMEAMGVAVRMAEVLALPAPPAAIAEPSGGIAFDDVRLTYPDGRVGLDGVSFRLEPGTMTALVGPSGAGKSSVVSLLLGFVTASGGTVAGLGGRIAWVPQRPYLFRGSIADNLRLGLPSASDDAIRHAAALTGADAVIATLPGGYDHPVGERGSGLSGGQARLIALTRAALLDAPLLILDEPTASLDRASEQQISEAVRRLSADRTVLVIAHRLDTVRTASSILVLDKGRIAERGDHGSLMAAGGLYAALVAEGLTS